MTVAEWIKHHPRHVVTAPVSSSVREVVELMSGQPGLRDVYVVSGPEILGHISIQSLASIVLAEHRSRHTRHQIMARVTMGSDLRDLMDARFASARIDEELDDVLDRQFDHGVEDMPVLDDAGRMRGSINLTEVLRAASQGEIWPGAAPSN